MKTKNDFSFGAESEKKRVWVSSWPQNYIAACQGENSNKKKAIRFVFSRASSLKLFFAV